jgi:hypothetical protein
MDDTPQVIPVLLAPFLRGVPPCTSKIDHPSISFNKVCRRRREIHRINRYRQIRVGGSFFVKKIFQCRNLEPLPVSRGNVFFPMVIHVSVIRLQISSPDSLSAERDFTIDWISAAVFFSVLYQCRLAVLTGGMRLLILSCFSIGFCFELGRRYRAHDFHVR